MIFIRYTPGPQRWAAFRLLLGVAAAVISFGDLARAAETTGGEPATEETAPPASFFIREYRVVGARQLPRDEIDMAVYAYMGPNRTEEDVQLARAALEQRYHRAGYQTVVVEVPPQDARNGVVILSVM